MISGIKLNEFQYKLSSNEHNCRRNLGLLCTCIIYIFINVPFSGAERPHCRIKAASNIFCHIPN